MQRKCPYSLLILMCLSIVSAQQDFNLTDISQVDDAPDSQTSNSSRRILTQQNSSPLVSDAWSFQTPDGEQALNLSIATSGCCGLRMDAQIGYYNDSRGIVHTTDATVRTVEDDWVYMEHGVQGIAVADSIFDVIIERNVISSDEIFHNELRHLLISDLKATNFIIGSCIFAGTGLQAWLTASCFYSFREGGDLDNPAAIITEALGLPDEASLRRVRNFLINLGIATRLMQGISQMKAYLDSLDPSVVPLSRRLKTIGLMSAIVTAQLTYLQVEISTLYFRWRGEKKLGVQGFRKLLGIDEKVLTVAANAVEKEGVPSDDNQGQVGFMPYSELETLLPKNQCPLNP